MLMSTAAAPKNVPTLPRPEPPPRGGKLALQVGSTGLTQVALEEAQTAEKRRNGERMGSKGEKKISHKCLRESQNV